MGVCLHTLFAVTGDFGSLLSSGPMSPHASVDDNRLACWLETSEFGLDRADDGLADSDNNDCYGLEAEVSDIQIRFSSPPPPLGLINVCPRYRKLSKRSFMTD
jgi:hypothetical protein